ncbi:MAG: thrombospondin type 3 repeat-containing protein [Gammaproteobacteria bacterium]
MKYLSVFIAALIFQSVLADHAIAASSPDKALVSSGHDDGPIEVAGHLQVIIGENFDGTPPTYDYWIKTEKRMLKLTAPPSDSLVSGALVRVSGTLRGHDLTANRFEVLSQPDRNTTHAIVGTRAIAVIQIGFTDDQIPTSTIAKIPGQMYTNVHYGGAFVSDYSNPSPSSVKAGLERFSFGQLQIEPDADGDGEFDIFGVYDVPYSSGDCSLYNNWADAADAAATADGVDLSLYQHKVYITPSHGCGWRGRGLINCDASSLIDCRAWSVAGPTLRHTVTHELGHNYNLQHTGADLDGDGIIVGDEGIGDKCTMMASGCDSTWGDQMLAIQRFFLGWYEAEPGALSSVTESGTYTLANLDNLSTDPHVLKIDVADGALLHQFSVSYRQGDFHPVTNLVSDFFGARADVANTLRIHQCYTTNCRRPRLEGQISEGETFLYDTHPLSNSTIGLYVVPGTLGGDTTQVDVYIGDTDNDGVFDYEDNCYLVANASQIDADCDGYGNACDADFNNDGYANLLDYAVLTQNFLTNDPVTDINGDGTVNFLDVNLFQGFFLQPPGPAGPEAACSTQP